MDFGGDATKFGMTQQTELAKKLTDVLKVKPSQLKATLNEKANGLAHQNIHHPTKVPPPPTPSPPHPPDCLPSWSPPSVLQRRKGCTVPGAYELQD